MQTSATVEDLVPAANSETSLPTHLGLAEASARLRYPYQYTHRLLLVGRLTGEKRGGRWLVTAESVNRVAQEDGRGEAELRD